MSFPTSQYGGRKFLTDLQRAGGGAGAPAPASSPTGIDPADLSPEQLRRAQALSGAVGEEAQGVFGPSRRPNEPLTAGAALGPGPGLDPTLSMDSDPNIFLQAMYAILPHPAIARLFDTE